MARRTPTRNRWPCGTVPPEPPESSPDLGWWLASCLSCGDDSPEDPFCAECQSRSRESELSPLYDDLGLPG